MVSPVPFSFLALARLRTLPTGYFQPMGGLDNSKPTHGYRMGIHRPVHTLSVPHLRVHNHAPLGIDVETSCKASLVGALPGPVTMPKFLLRALSGICSAERL